MKTYPVKTIYFIWIFIAKIRCLYPKSWTFIAKYYVTIYIFIILINIHYRHISCCYINIFIVNIYVFTPVKTPLIIQLFSTLQSTYQYFHRLNTTTQITSDTYYDTYNHQNIQHTTPSSCIIISQIYDGQILYL